MDATDSTSVSTPSFKYRLVARGIAIFLLGAAALKLYGLRTGPIAGAGIFSTPEIQLAAVEFELLLGVWLLCGVQPLACWFCTFVAFVAFAGISSYLGLVGQASCGCFGQLAVNPWITLVIDVIILIILLAARPAFSAAATGPHLDLAKAAFSVCCVAGIVALMSGAIVGLGSYFFSSLPEALAYCRGERISIEPRLLDVGAGADGALQHANLAVSNWTDKPIRIIGTSRDCACTVQDLPVVIPPKETRSISIGVRLAGTPGILTKKGLLRVDDEGLKDLNFRMTGRIVPRGVAPDLTSQIPDQGVSANRKRKGE